MANSVFLNYRHGDSDGSAGRIFDLLSPRLKDAKIFMDVDALEPGVDFTRAIDEQLAECAYFIAVIGPNWANAQGPDGRRRLDDPGDYVRLEIEAALRRGVRVVPVLVDGAQMPKPGELPETLRSFATRNAFVVAHHKFASDVADLAKFAMRNLGIEVEQSSGASQPSSSWADVLLSFRGRLSRKRYWLGSLALLPLSFGIHYLLLLAVGESIDVILLKPHEIPIRHHLVTLVGGLPFWWIWLALLAKRLHDFNAGGGFVAVLFGLMALLITLNLIVFGMSADPDYRETKEVAVLQGVVFGLSMLFSIMLLAIGAIRGTPGANRYGPDPLSRR
jgi:uncharacterized membrane protein YhaH (DUF805 family)